MNAAIRRSCSNGSGRAMLVTPGAISRRSERRRVAARPGVMYGPPYDQPLPIVRSMRSPSSRARRDVNAIRSRNSAERYG